MHRQKRMPTQKELVNVARARKLAGGSGKPHKSAMFSKSAYVPRTSHLENIKVEVGEELQLLQWVD